MLIRKAMLAASVVGLMAAPGAAIAHDTGHGKHNGTTQHGAKKCKPHKVAYVAAGLLVSHTLVADVVEEGERQTYSGDLTVDVKRANRHAKADKGTTKTYTLDGARVLLRLEDQNADGVVNLDDVQADSRVRVIGKVTKLAKRCDQTGFEPELKVRKVIVHAPRPAEGS